MSRFIDVHVHPPASVLVADGFRPYLEPGMVPDGPGGFPELAAYYRDCDGRALVHAFDAGSAIGSAALTNDRLAESLAPHAEVLAGLGCVDPHRGEAAVVATHDAYRMGLKGLFFHPAAQQFDPAGRRSAPLWDMAEQLRLPVVVHCGTTPMGSGMPGGAGIALDLADPMRMDRVAARHPGLQIVLAGITPPWEEAAAAVVTHKTNVHLAVSGTAPDRLGRHLREAVTGALAAKSMMGSGFPFATPERWLEGWASLEPAAEIDEAVRYGNAAELFGV